MKTAIVAGATGLVGNELCRQLARPDSGFDRVVALRRRPLDFSSPKLVSQPGDFENLSLPPCDVALCALGTTIAVAGSEAAFRKVDYDFVINFAQAAKLAGANTFVLLTSVGAAPNAGSFYLRVKGEVETAVEAIGFDSLYILRPSLLVGSRKQPRLGERIATVAASFLQFGLVGPLRKYRPIRSELVAAAMCDAALESRPGRHVWHYDEIVSPAQRHPGRA